MISFAAKLEADAKARALTLKVLNGAMGVAMVASVLTLGYLCWTLL